MQTVFVRRLTSMVLVKIIMMMIILHSIPD